MLGFTRWVITRSRRMWWLTHHSSCGSSASGSGTRLVCATSPTRWARTDDRGYPERGTTRLPGFQTRATHRQSYRGPARADSGSFYFFNEVHMRRSNLALLALAGALACDSPVEAQPTLRSAA